MHFLVRVLTAATVVLCTTMAYGGGYLIVTNTGVPFKWATIPVPFNPDQGPLGKLTNTEAVDLMLDNANAWSTVNIPTCALSFTNAGALDKDHKTGSDYNSIVGKNDGISPVIFDADGSILEDLGLPSGVIGRAGPEFISTVAPFRILQGTAIFNGAFIDDEVLDGREMSVEAFAGVVAHEFGHYVNLDHTSVNGHYFLGDTDDPGFARYGAPPVSSVNLMYPLAIDNQPTTPLMDDRVWVSNLYPVAPFPGDHGTISGSLFLKDGATLLQGGNVIARKPDDPFLNAVSNVSGALYNPTSDIPSSGSADPDEAGVFNLPGLDPNANYTVEVVNVNSRFAGGSKVGPVDPPILLSGPEEFYSGVTENANPDEDDPSVATEVTATTGDGVSGIDIILNEPAAFLPPPVELTATVFENTVTLDWVDPNQGGEFELAFDDGSFEQFVGFQGGSGELANGPFVPPAYPATITSARFLASAVGENVRIRVYVDETGSASAPSGGMLEGTTPDVEIEQRRVFQTVDLSSLNITLNEPAHFFLSVHQIDTTNIGLGLDNNAPDGNAFFGGGGSFQPLSDAGFSGVFGIRAVVEVNSGGSIASKPAAVAPPRNQLEAEATPGRLAVLPGAAPVTMPGPRLQRSGFGHGLSQLDLIGFNIYRSTQTDAVNTGTIVGSSADSVVTFSDSNLSLGTFYYQVTAVYGEGESGPSNEVEAVVVTTPVHNEPTLPEDYALEQNHPNPFNPTTVVRYAIPERHGEGVVRLEIFNLLGQKIRTLVQERQPAGAYSVTWDGRDEAGRPVSTGVYVYRLRAGDFVESRKMVLLR